MRDFNWRLLLLPSYGLVGLWLAFDAAAWFWEGNAQTASLVRAAAVAAQVVTGLGVAAWGWWQTVQRVREEERLVAQMLAKTEGEAPGQPALPRTRVPDPSWIAESEPPRALEQRGGARGGGGEPA